MELHTVRHVSKTFNISAQMLRYYEQSGLLQSLRKEDYAYRVYDDENVMRLQRIILPRPIKQIRVILNNPDASIAIDILKKNISELDNEISALITVKTALEIFISKIEEISAVKLSLDVLTDDTVLELADSLSLAQRNINENRLMDEFNTANKQIIVQKSNHNQARRWLLCYNVYKVVRKCTHMNRFKKRWIILRTTGVMKCLQWCLRKHTEYFRRNIAIIRNR